MFIFVTTLRVKVYFVVSRIRYLNFGTYNYFTICLQYNT